MRLTCACGRPQAARKSTCYPCLHLERKARARELRSAAAAAEAAVPVQDHAAPCPHPPGSAGKIAWLEARASARAELFRADDAGEWDGGCLPPSAKIKLLVGGVRDRQGDRAGKPAPSRRKAVTEVRP